MMMKPMPRHVPFLFLVAVDSFISNRNTYFWFVPITRQKRKGPTFNIEHGNPNLGGGGGGGLRQPNPTHPYVSHTNNLLVNAFC